MAREVVVNCDIHHTPGANEWMFVSSEGKRWCIDLCPDVCEKQLLDEFINHAREDDQRSSPVNSSPRVAGRKYSRYVRGLPPPPGQG